MSFIFDNIKTVPQRFISGVNQSNALTRNTMLIIIIVALALAGLAYAYYKFVVLKDKKFQANREHGTKDSSKTAELMFFYVDWCPHCKTAKPIWEDLKSDPETKNINGYTVTFTEVNCTTETAEIEKLMDEYKIEGYPTIKLKRDGQIIEYDAKPSKATLLQFLQAAL